MYTQTMERNQPVKQVSARNQLKVLRKFSICKCGRKRKIIYSGGVDPLLFIKEKRLASREARKVRCKDQKGTYQGMHLNDKGKYAILC